MKPIKVLIIIAGLILLLESCSKIDNKRDIVVYSEGSFYDDNTRQYTYKDLEEKYKVKAGDHFKKYIVSNPKYTLAGQPIHVRITSDGKEIYKQVNQVHNIDILIE